MPESVPHKPRTVEKPWGHETIYAETDRYAGKVLFVAKGRRLSLQYHERKSETMYLLRGHVRMTVGPAADALHDVDLCPGDAIDLPAGTVHRVEAIEDSEILETSTPELDDVIRLADDFGRESTSAP